MVYKRLGTRQILLALQTDDDTPVALAGTNAFLTFEGEVEIQVDTASRTPDSKYFTADEEVEIGTRFKITTKADILGAATAGLTAPVSPFLQIAGFAETLTVATKSVFNPITDNIKCASVGFYQGGMLFSSVGARADLEITRSSGSFADNTFTITGVVADEDAVISQTAIPTLTIVNPRRAPAIRPGANWTVTLNGFEVECITNNLKYGASVDYVGTSKSGRVVTTMRKPSGVLSVLLPDLSDLNPWQLAADQTRVVLTDVLDGGATKKSTITMNHVELRKPKSFKNKNNLIQLDIPYVPYPTDGVGNDEVLIQLD
jgi:hypothetical protein